MIDLLLTAIVFGLFLTPVAAYSVGAILNPRLATLNAWLVYLFFYAPIILLVVFSFSDDQIVGEWGGFTLDWYRAFADNEPTG